VRIDQQLHGGRLAGSASFIPRTDALASAFFAANSSRSFATVFNGQYIGFGATTRVVTFPSQNIY
jgi:penicillin-binding protein-related factor A (putative recombinase)